MYRYVNLHVHTEIYRDTLIQQGKDTIAQLQEEIRTEKERNEQQLHRLEEEKDHLASVVHTLTRKTEELQDENGHLKIDLEKAREQCTDAARFLNKELEKVRFLHKQCNINSYL